MREKGVGSAPEQFSATFNEPRIAHARAGHQIVRSVTAADGDG